MATLKQFRRRGRWSLIIGTLFAVLTFGAVMAFASASVPIGGTIDWTGQGTTNGVLNTSLCGGDANFGGISTLPPGATSTNYLLWIFTVGNGNTVTSATLNTNGDETTWPTDAWTTTSGNQIKFITKGYDLSTLTAFVDYVGALGSGNSNLVISHGCAGKAQPEISTEASATGEGVTGDTLNDTATLSGGNSPTGTITFKLYSGTDTTCSTSLYSEDVTVDSGNGDYSTATGFVVQTKGTYQWVASYSGDGNNEPATTSCNDPAEALVVDAAAPDIETAIHLGKSDGEGTPTVVGGDTHVDLGSFVHDSATATGGPSTPEGTVDFTFYNTIDCTDAGVAAGSDVALVSGVAHPSDDEGALGAGSYGFKAFYTSSDTDKWQNSESICEPLTVDKAQLTIVTQIHDAQHNPVGGSTSVPLGSVVHDTATVTGQVQGFDPQGAITFTLDGNLVSQINPAEVGFTATTVDSAPLGAGSYTYRASVAGDDNYIGDRSGPEPLTVDKGDLTITTYIHDSQHNVVTEVPVDGTVHDTAHLGGVVSGFDPTADNVSFTFYNTIDCTGDGVSKTNTGADEVTTPDPRSEDVGPLASGAYSFQASFANDANYNDAGPSDCEPLHVRTFGYTMGFWGNVNGQALLVANNAFSPGVTLGLVAANVTNNRCLVIVSSAARSKTILPNTLNGASLIVQCDTTAERDTGINANSFNVLLAQNLALSYNNLYKAGFAGQTIGAMGCTAVGTLSATSTTQDAQDYGNYLIGNLIKTGGTNNSAVITQGQIGAMNTLLGCMNTES